MSSTRMAEADTAPRMSAIACAGCIIIGTIARANCTHAGFSSATMLVGGAPARSVSVRCSWNLVISGECRNAAVPPRYAGDRFVRKKAVSGARAYDSPLLVRKPSVVRESHRILAPRGVTPQAFAIAAG